MRRTNLAFSVAWLKPGRGLNWVWLRVFKEKTVSGAATLSPRKNKKLERGGIDRGTKPGRTYLSPTVDEERRCGAGNVKRTQQKNRLSGRATGSRQIQG